MDYKRDMKIAVIFLLVLCCCMLFVALLANNGNNVIAEVTPAKTSISHFEEHFPEAPAPSDFNLERFVDELRAKNKNLEEYLNTTELNASERLAIANALSNLELAIGNIEVAINESNR